MEYQDFLELAKKRRNTKNFSDKSIKDEDIKRILDVARHAPSGANSQPWEFIVIKDDETREAIHEIYEENYVRRIGLERARDPEYRFWGSHTPEPDSESFSHPLKQAPVYIIQIGDPRTTEMYNWAANASMRHRLSNFYSSLANANLLAHLAAHALGLGMKYNTIIGEVDIESRIKQLLDIPDDYILYEILALGHYAYEPMDVPRKSLDEIVHWGKYDRSMYKDEEEIDEWIKARRARRREFREQAESSD